MQVSLKVGRRRSLLLSFKFLILLQVVRFLFAWGLSVLGSAVGAGGTGCVGEHSKSSFFKSGAWLLAAVLQEDGAQLILSLGVATSVCQFDAAGYILYNTQSVHVMNSLMDRCISLCAQSLQC